MKKITAEMILEKLKEINWYNENIKPVVEELKKLNKNFYFVGGTLRDIIISIIYNKKFNPQDIDIVVEIENYDELSKIIETLFKEDINKNNVKIVKYPHFLTLSIIFINEYRRIDLSLPRKEKYKYNGALPDVELGRVEDDLFRRDFSINSIALIVSQDYFAILDPFKGIDDIINKKIRILHKKSFLDDPTRIIRAIRLSAKLKFNLEKTTACLITEAIKKKVFSKVSKIRLANEFVNILKKGENLEIVVKLLKKFKIVEVYSFINDIIFCFIRNYKYIELKELEIQQEYKFYIRLLYLLEKSCIEEQPVKKNEKIKNFFIELGIPHSIRGEIYKALDVFSGKRRLKETDSWIELYAKIYKKNITFSNQ